MISFVSLRKSRFYLDELPLEVPEFSELDELVLTPFVFFNLAACRAAASPDIGFS